MIHWVYTAILCPRLLYATVVWWPGVRKRTAIATLEHVRALMLRGALDAMQTTLVAAIGMLFGIELLQQAVLAAVAAAAHRLRRELK